MSKKRKQTKSHSPKTITLLQQLERRRGVRELAKRFLIVCEDDKSAPNYFQALIKHLNLSASSVRPIGSSGHTQPLQIVGLAVKLKEVAARADSGTEPFDQVWCLIDGDYGSKINNSRSKARAHGIHLAISTLCFEYWILLHFEENGKPTNSCDDLIKYLKRAHIHNYQKGSCDFSQIVENVSEACKRAQRLRQPGIDRGDLPENQNPCSEVYLLISEILKY